MKKLRTRFLVVMVLISCSDRKLPKVKSLSELSKTNFMISPKDSLKNGSNGIYCTTLGYAWAEIEKALHHDIQIEDSVYYLKQLQNSSAYTNSLTESEISTGYEIQGDIVKATAEFKKSLSFETRFNRNCSPLIFGEEEVESFGLKYYERDIAKQVDVLFYESDEEFAIRLNPEEEEHEILLYMPKSKAFKNLEECNNKLNQKIEKHQAIIKTEKNAWFYEYNNIDELSIPIFEFNLETKFSRLENKYFKTSQSLFQVAEAYQRIGLLLDEKGAEIESEAGIAVEAACEAPDELIEPTPKRLIFDKPFLIQFKRRGVKNPYLIIWV